MRTILLVSCVFFPLFMTGDIARGDDDPPPLKYSGLAGQALTQVTASEQVGAGNQGLIFAPTEDGFHYLDEDDGQWVARTEPGVPGRAVRSIATHIWEHDLLIIGRVDAEGRGYIERSTDLGQTYEIVHHSSAGAVVDITYHGSYYGEYLACTEASEVSGELLFSADVGASWQVVAGHGQTSLSAIWWLGGERIFVAGDNGLAVSTDAGDSWQPVGGGLPPGPVHCLLRRGP